MATPTGSALLAVLPRGTILPRPGLSGGLQMAPFTCGHCPVCAARTRQHLLVVPEDEAGDLEVICEDCETVLIFGEAGLVGQRPATEEERAAIPEKHHLSKEELAMWREDMREGQLALEAWIQEGCPGLDSEMLRDRLNSPEMAAALAQMRANLP